MSWLFSKALIKAYGNSPSSPERAEEFSEGICSGGEQCAQWNVMPTPQGFWRNDKMMDVSRLSQFGPTLRLLTVQDGEALLMSYLAAFPVRTLAHREPKKGSTGGAPASGANLPGLLAKYDPDSSSWKTAQCSLFSDSIESLATFPKWGMTRNGGLYLRRTAGLPICESASGLLPTLTVCGNYNRPGASKKSGMWLATYLTLRATDTGAGEKSETFVKRMGDRGEHCFQSLPSQMGGPLNPRWCEGFMGFPIGWTELKPLAMDKFQEWQQQHSLSFQNRSDAA